jgi:hypothetical protein
MVFLWVTGFAESALRPGPGALKPGALKPADVMPVEAGLVGVSVDWEAAPFDSGEDTA